MLLKRIYDPKLAQASYLIGCSRTGEALVVDPNRDVGQYVAAARAEGLRVAHVTETHIHADFVSGSLELARQSGARLYLSDEGGPDWRYAFADAAGAVPLREGASFTVGDVHVKVVHTPGHTPEHLTFLLTDTASADRPMGALTGDFIFVGDVGRPDLLERAARQAGTMEASARQLFQSLQRFKAQPDYLQIWPAHGAGSACGKALGAMPQSTMGYERLFNWAFAIDDEDTFVAAVLAGQPDPPRYFARMKQVNRDGPPAAGTREAPRRVEMDEALRAVAAGALMLDTRPTASFADGHVPGALHIPLNRAFPTWAGSLIPPDRELMLVADDSRVAEAWRDLALVGLDRIGGFVSADALAAYRAAGGALATMQQMDVNQLAAQLGGDSAVVLDVRAPSEWGAGHLPGVANIPLGELPDRLAEVPRDRPVVLHCQGGTRSAIATSLLEANGVESVVNLTGGYAAWRAAGHPAESS